MTGRLRHVLFGFIGILLIIVWGYLLQKLGFGELFRGSKSYLPPGYSITKDSEMRESDIGKIYETVLTNGDKSIRIIKSNKYPHDCEGVKKEMAGREVCYFGFGENPHLPKELKAVLWTSETNNYQLTTNDSSLDESELTRLIKNFQ